jgi:hypothetical protein
VLQYSLEKEPLLLHDIVLSHILVHFLRVECDVFEGKVLLCKCAYVSPLFLMGLAMINQGDDICPVLTHSPIFVVVGKLFIAKQLLFSLRG